jgi:hypothetical protein
MSRGIPVRELQKPKVKMGREANGKTGVLARPDSYGE